LTTIGVAIGLVALWTPASALAGGPWAVKDADGQVIGTVRTVSSQKARVEVQGQDAGEINRTSRGKWTAFGFLSGHMEAVHIRHAALWGKTPAWQLRGFAEMGPLLLAGRILKRNGRWIVQEGNRSRGWTTRGSVTGACPAWGAGGSVLLALAPYF
jgi:hypothetical protein